jgi:hypothetical protein
MLEHEQHNRMRAHALIPGAMLLLALAPLRAAVGTAPSALGAVTSQCITSSFLNTNIMLAQGFGTAAANGTYNWNGSTRFTNGVNVLYFDSGYGAWIISNSVSGVLYDSFGVPVIGGTQTWDDIVGGAGPLGTTTYGPITNCFTSVSFPAAVALPGLTTNLYVDCGIGNDTNAVRGRIDLPWKTVKAALLVLRRGERVIVQPGMYPEVDGGTMILTNGGALIGAGFGVTVIGTAQGQEDSLFLCSDTVAANFTFHGKIVVGEGQQFSSGAAANEATNVLVRGMSFDGQADGLGLDTWRDFHLEDAFISDNFDGVANWDNRGIAKSAWFKNVHIFSIKTNSFEQIHGVSWLSGNLFWDGGSITASNGQTHNAGIYIPASTNAPAVMLLNGVRITHFTTNNAVSLAVWNSNSARVLITGGYINEVQPPLINSLITNQPSDHVVGVTNANSTHTAGRTNKLIDTTWFGTNGYLAGKYEVRVYDRTSTAAGTNIWIETVGNQKINGGPTTTNISANGGAITLSVGGIGGTNWVITAKFP